MIDLSRSISPIDTKSKYWSIGPQFVILQNPEANIKLLISTTVIGTIICQIGNELVPIIITDVSYYYFSFAASSMRKEAYDT
jgi:beta-lactam-binding protein with PASTA domain